MTDPDQGDRLFDDVIAALDGSRVDVLRSLLGGLEPGEVRQLFGRLDAERSAAALTALEPEHAAEVVLWLAPEQSADVLSNVEPDAGAAIASQLPSDERADVLGEMSEEPREALQAQLPREQREEAERLLEYAPDSAGGLMETELLSYAAGTPVKEVILDLRSHQEQYAGMGVQYAYVVDADRRLLGAAPMRELLLAPERAPIESLLRGAPISVRDTAETREVADLFDEHRFIGLPVVDEQGRLLGVINRADVEEAGAEQADEQYRLSQGIVGGEELRTMPMGRRFRRRTLWLGVNMILCLGGAAVIAGHQETLARVIIVAALLPIVSATSGNAAMQAAAVSIRELTLGIIDPGSWMRVLRHELMLSLLMAVPLGMAVALLAQIWGAPLILGAAAGLAMAMNAVIAVAIGAVVPLLLRRVGVDPALASGPLATTLADVSGFLLVFACVGWMA